MATEAATLEALTARITELESRSSIRDLVSDYCHGFDKRDYDKFLSIWWEDCVWDIGPPFGRFEGHSGIHEAIYDVLWPAWGESHHLSTNLKITFSDTDNATSICDVDCMGKLIDEDTCTIVGATYADQLQRRAGVWKILQRTVTIHYFNPIPGTVLSAPEAG
ncbi:nuclear transport factor 2 family protein [Halieaceae bacterium IMCC14734]|uniref:Nuclear transport factor 2 family protein n=1 Tax=Candidatus Litorirhabdus singularis TaxID=2518993 RepID=A0ABT3TM90_9GAMM|nr:nuclear transport factor 2 family protein [Candidatus Litorirhabdus singularis]MCX2982831.1 nuclear transport factor 2 family protein [Candidatus Litorirhabdus singularis]